MKAAFILACAVASFAAPALASSNVTRDRNNREIEAHFTELREDFEFVIREEAYRKCRMNEAIPEKVCKHISGMDELSSRRNSASK